MTGAVKRMKSERSKLKRSRSERGRPAGNGAAPPGASGCRYVKRTLAAAAIALVAASGAPAQDVGELLRAAGDALYPDTFVMTISMETHRPDRRDSAMTIRSQHSDEHGTRLEILEPARSRGTRFLRKGDDLWMFSPRSNSSRAIRLSPRDSFQGSVFANNDIGDPDYSDDYDATLAGTETIDHPELGRVETRRIEATASHPEAPYGRITMWLRTGDDIPVLMEYYAKSGVLIKRMRLHSLEELAGRVRPTVMRMESLEIEDAYSIVEIEELEQRESLSARLFSQAALTR